MKLLTILLLGLLPATALGAVTEGGPVSPDGTTRIVVDLPREQRISNVESYGAGMCVNTSIEMVARYQNLESLRGFRDWSTKYPGGSFNDKVDRQLAEYCKVKGIPIPKYFQYTGSDITVVQSVLKTGRAVAVTYGGRDGVRYRNSIYHMVVCICCDEKWTCLLDNNNIEDNKYLWMPTDEFVPRWYEGGKTGWCVGFLDVPPPPIPVEPLGVKDMKYALLLSSVLLMTPDAQAAWGGSSCSSVDEIGDLYWKLSPSGEQYWLMKERAQLGTYVIDEDEFYFGNPYEGFHKGVLRDDLRRLLMKLRHPLQPLPPKNFGVDRNRGDTGGCSINGKPVSKDDLLSTIAGPVPADDKFLRITLIGDATERAKMAQTIATATELSYWRDKIVLNSYPSDHWRVKQCGFDTTGHPTVVLQTPDGRKTVTCDGGKCSVADIRKQLIAIDLSWSMTVDPYKDPPADPVNPLNPATPVSGIPMCCLIGAGLIGVGYWLTKKRE